VFTFWELSVLSLGLSSLFQRDFPKVFVLVFAIWILWSAFMLLTGFTFGT
jgi:membrane associated rhomboid family serine protease